MFEMHLSRAPFDFLALYRSAIASCATQCWWFQLCWRWMSLWV